MLRTYGSHPRTRSSAASAGFGTMKGIMLIAGIVLLIGGATHIIDSSDFAEQVTTALIATFYALTPLSIHFYRR
jgi:hypothetical protein